MGSSLVPIMLIVVLLVGAVVFVVLSSRSPRSGYEPRRRRSLETRRGRPGAIPLRDSPPPDPPDDVVPGFAPAATPASAQPAPIAASSADATGADAASTPGGPGRPAAAGDVTGWGDDGGWDDGEATRIGSLGDPGTGAHAPPTPPTEDQQDRFDTAASGPGGSATGGHNIGGGYPAGADGRFPDQPYPDARQAGAVPPGASHTGAHALGGIDTTGGIDTSGHDSGGRETYMNDSRDPDATGWTPPPSGRPHHADADDSTYKLAFDARDQNQGNGGFPRSAAAGYTGPETYPDPKAGETVRIGPTGPGAAGGTGGMGGTGGTGGPAAAHDTAWDVPVAATAPTVPTPDPGAPGLVAAEPAQATAPALRLAAAGRTRRGKRGGPNEDAFVVSDGLLAVSDGVGGEAAGQIASTLTVTTVAGFRPQYAEDPADGLRQAVARANRVVREKPREEPSWRGMACTLDVVILGRQRATGETLFIAHVGDSSVWLQPQKGRPHQLTTPHAIKNGPLLNAVGLADQIDVDILSEPVRAGDRVILASDGITKVMTPEQLLGLMTELGSEPPERAADALVEAALLAGARDDTTIVVADLVSEPSAR